MTTTVDAGLRFIRSGYWLLLLGFAMSVGMVLHYVVGAQYLTGHLGVVIAFGDIRRVSHDVGARSAH